MYPKDQSPGLVLVRALRRSRKKTLSVSFLSHYLSQTESSTLKILGRLEEVEVVSQSNGNVTLLMA